MTGVTSVAWNGNSIIETGWHNVMDIILQDKTRIGRVWRREQPIQLFLRVGLLPRSLRPGIRPCHRAQVVSLPVARHRRILRASSYQKGMEARRDSRSERRDTQPVNLQPFG